MTGKAKEFLALLSSDKALREELKDADEKKLLAAAKSRGFELAAEDFEPDEMSEISEDEMKDVAGGLIQCTCGAKGSGLGGDVDCLCTGGGTGTNITTGGWKCSCMPMGQNTGFGMGCD